MRRFFSLLMCVSGLSLAVTYTHADEPAAAPADAAAQPELAAPQSDSDGGSPESTDPAAGARRELDEMLRRWRQLYRQVVDDEQLRGEVQSNIEQLTRLYGESRRLAETYTGEALEQASAALDKQIARIEESLEAAESLTLADSEHGADDRQSEESGDKGDPRESAAPDRSQAAIESHLANLRALAEQLEQSAGEEAEKARAAVEQQIDQFERYLAERRERREAAGRPPMREVMDTERRLAALKSAIAQLKRGRFDEQAAALEPLLARLEIQAQRHRELFRAAREAADVDLRKSQPRLHIEQRREAGAFTEIGDLSAEVRELRRELRRLRAEVQELRQQHAPQPDREDTGGQSPDRESE